MADSDDDGDEKVPKKHKKRNKKQEEEAPVKLGKMKPKSFTPKELQPFQRVLWCNPVDHAAAGSDETQALRRKLGLRVPDVRRLPCKFWQRGACARGDACSFAHVAAGNADDGNSSSSGARCPPPVLDLSDPGLPKCIGRAMLHFGHRKPAPIQSQTWSAALCGHDLLCRAPTGSGKTLAYILPAAAHALVATPPGPGGGPNALVLVPTRELAMQVHGLCQSLRRPCGIKAEAVYGGEPREDQVEALESGGIHLLVATTGRLVDMLMSKQASLSRATLLILDEADQLLTLGFSLQVNQILSQLRPDRQTLLFSATLSERLEVAAGSWLKAPMRIYAEENYGAQQGGGGAGSEDEDEADGAAGLLPDGVATASSAGGGGGAGGAGGGGGDAQTGEGGGDGRGEQLSEVPSNIEQRFIMCEEGGKSAALLLLLESLGHSVTSHDGETVGGGSASGGGSALSGGSAAARGMAAARGSSDVAKQPRGRNVPRVMVFVNEIKHIKKLGARLKACGVKCEALHGQKSQRERDDALRLFKAGASPVLLTSDLGSRGLDVARLPAIVNYDPPTSAAQYVHRAGRTGRQGAAGLAVTLLKHDAPSKHLAMQVRGMLQRARTALPSALLALLPALAEAPIEPARLVSASGKRRHEGNSEGKQKKKKKKMMMMMYESPDVEGGGGASQDGNDGGTALGGLSDLMSFAQAAAGRIA